MNRIRRFRTIVSMLLVMLTAAGCSGMLFPAKGKPDLRGHEEYARECYERGITYMKNARYELARQQFSFAAASAVSEELHLKAAEGIRRVDRVIKQNR